MSILKIFLLELEFFESDRIIQSIEVSIIHVLIIYPSSEFEKAILLIHNSLSRSSFFSWFTIPIYLDFSINFIKSISLYV